MSRNTALRTLTLAFAMWTTAISVIAAEPNTLEAAFHHPPDSARAHTWWHWMNGHVRKAGITKDLEAMKAMGLGGFQAFHVTDRIPDNGPVPYDSDKWHEMMAHTIREAERLGLQMCFHNCAGWSSSGGPWITPEHSMQEVVWSEQRVTGGQPQTITLPQPPTKRDYYRDIAVLAFPTPTLEAAGEAGFRIKDWEQKTKSGGWRCRFPAKIEQADANAIVAADRIVNLSSRMNETGALTWDAPAGDWTILRLGYTTTGQTNKPAPDEGRGLECDKLSQAGVDLHWNNIVQRVLNDAGPRVGKTLYSVLIDSYEVGEQNWTHDFAQQFQTRRGYDLTPWLVCLTGRAVGDVERTERFLWDLRRTIADLMDENYFGRFAELSHEHGLQLSIEPYGDGSFDAFQAARNADIPMGEWWVNGRDSWLDFSVRLASSAAHIDGKRYVGAESFTAGNQSAAWVTHPYTIKTYGDYNYTRGINRFIFHTCVHQPWADDILPGMTMGPHGMQMNRNNTWPLHAREWFDRLARCQYLLQEGRHVADLLYIYGEDAPNTPDNRPELTPAPPAGYDFDASSATTLMQLFVKDGRLTLPSGASYRLLVLRHAQRMRPAFAEKLAELVEQGAVIVGSKPVGSPSLEDFPHCDDVVRKIAAELWNNKRIRPSQDLGQTFAELGLAPDFEATKTSGATGETGLAYIHRRIAVPDADTDAEVYFVSNQHHLHRTIRGVFRVAGRQPEIWRPETGTIAPAAIWEPLEDGRTAVTLDLQPADAVFVVFRQPATGLDPITKLTFEPRDADLPSTDEDAFTVTNAWYGDPNDANRGADVTDVVRQRIAAGNWRIPARNNVFGDPVRNTAKVLRVTYQYLGQPQTISIPENQSLNFDQLVGRTDEPPIYAVHVQDNQARACIYTPGNLTGQRQSGATLSMNIATVPPPIEFEQPWTVSFGPMGPSQPVKFDQLIPWNEHDNDDIKYYSGSATYQTTFELPATLVTKDQPLILDLGNVEVMARIRLNGQDLGLLWKPPFRQDISAAIQPGENQLEVTVINLWINRLIGDERYPDIAERTDNGRGQGLAKVPLWLTLNQPMPETQRKTFTAWRHWSKDRPLSPSGLLGPVRIYAPVVEVLK